MRDGLFLALLLYLHLPLPLLLPPSHAHSRTHYQLRIFICHYSHGLLSCGSTLNRLYYRAYRGVRKSRDGFFFYLTMPISLLLILRTCDGSKFLSCLQHTCSLPKLMLYNRFCLLLCAETGQHGDTCGSVCERMRSCGDGTLGGKSQGISLVQGRRQVP